MKTQKKNVYIINPSNRYGFKVNINHPAAEKQFKAFKEFRHIGKHGMTDELRKDFEKQFISSRYFKRCLVIEKSLYGEGYDYIIRQALGNEYFNEWKKQYA